jgi:hypothetical protein
MQKGLIFILAVVVVGDIFEFALMSYNMYKNLDQLCKISLKSLLRDVKLKYNTIQYNTITFSNM